jgi:6-pyruvoyltetrahydropterin/6-carboxytetrahydropterin synthase
MLTCTKLYPDLPFAHRQHKHAGHCSLIHGHNWSVQLTFACHQLDRHGFVVDFGDLKYIKHWLDDHLDHACVFATDDPLKDTMLAAAPDVWKVFEVESASCEGICERLYDELNALVLQHEQGRAWIASITLHEDRHNYATYTPSRPPGHTA